MYIIALTVFPVNVMFNKKINKKGTFIEQRWIVSFYSLDLKHACFHFINFINKSIRVLAAFAQVKEVVNMNICCLFLSMCTLL